MGTCLKCDANLDDGSGRCPFCGAWEEGDAHIGNVSEALPEGEKVLDDAAFEAELKDEPEEPDEKAGEKEPKPEDAKGSPEPEQAEAQADGGSDAAADHPDDGSEQKEAV